MTIYTNTPYTYRIGWSKTGMNYYGVRYAADCHPSDLFVSYFTSSEYVAQYIKEHGNPDIIEVRRTFTGEERVNKAILHEQKVLQRIGVVGRQDYLNKHDGRAIDLSDPVVYNKMVNGVREAMKRPEVLQKLKDVSAKPEVKKRRREGALKSWQDEAMKKRRVASFNTPEARAKRKASMELSYVDPEAKARRSASSVEINARPEVLKANKERFLGKTFEELFGEDRAKEIKAKLADGTAKRWAEGNLKGRSGVENSYADKTIYQWQNVETGEIVFMARSEMCAKYKLENANVQHLFYKRGKTNRYGRFYSVKGWMLLPD